MLSYITSLYACLVYPISCSIPLRAACVLPHGIGGGVIIVEGRHAIKMARDYLSLRHNVGQIIMAIWHTWVRQAEQARGCFLSIQIGPSADLISGNTQRREAGRKRDSVVPLLHSDRYQVQRTERCEDNCSAQR